VKPAAAISGRLARLILLACTALAVAALHTVGHAGTPDLDHREVAAGTVSTMAAMAVLLAPADDGGCHCNHTGAVPMRGQDSTRWWELCLAILSLLVVVVLISAMSRRTRDTRPAVAGCARPRSSPQRSHRPFGLVITAVAVIRT
jgi:hypothetical protein